MPPGDAVATGKNSGGHLHQTVHARDSGSDDRDRDGGPEMLPSSPSATLGHVVIFLASYVISDQPTNFRVGESLSSGNAKMVRAAPNSTSNGRQRHER